jgi:hypothetical protein
VENKGFSEESLREIANKKVTFRFSLKIHIGVFIIVSILLLLINLLSTPNYWWIIYPFFGWLIGVMEHLTAYLVYARGVYPIAKRGVIFHLISYIFVIFFLFLINIYTFTHAQIYPIYFWVVFPTVFWGAALILHIVAYFIYFRKKIDEQGEIKSRREKAIEKEIKKIKDKINI